MRLSELDIDGHLLVRLTGIVIDRPVLELQVRRLARQPRMDLQARSKEDLAKALLVFARKQAPVDELLGKEALKATAAERQHLQTLGDDWKDVLRPVFEQKRTGAKFLLAMLLSPAPWPERGRAYTEEFIRVAEHRAQLLQRAEQGGVKETLLHLEKEFSAVNRRSSALEEKVITLERQRASVLAELGQREAELKNAGQKAQQLERELSSVKKIAPAQTNSETEELKRKLRRLEKQAAFARERERDREALSRVEHERDALLKELHVVRLQLQVSRVAQMVVPPRPRDPSQPAASVASEPAHQPGRQAMHAVYVDGANLSAIARNLFHKNPSFAALRDLLVPRGENAMLKAYIVDTGSDGFSAYLRSLKQQGFSVVKRTPKRLPDGSTKADMDLHLAVDVMADQPGPSRVVLVTGDSDFVPLVKTLKSRGVRVEAAMFRQRTAHELVEAVDTFWQLDESVLIG